MPHPPEYNLTEDGYIWSITNNHVLPLTAAAREARAEFGYERDIGAGASAEAIIKFRPDLLFLTNVNMRFGGLDYTVVALSRQAGRVWFSRPDARCYHRLRREDLRSSAPWWQTQSICCEPQPQSQ